MLSAAALLLPLTAGLALQVRVQVGTPPDTTVEREVETRQRPDSGQRDRTLEIRRIPVTAEHLATAFMDVRARTLLERARVARLRQDSSLLSYDVKSYQRASVGMALKAIARERLFLRHENAARIRWRRGVGAVIDVTGARTVMPALKGTDAEADIDGTASIPYYPGRDDLWFGAEAVQADRETTVLVHPIAAGAEAYYRYATGDSVTFALPDGQRLRLVELRVRPREPSWRLAVGSLWFDAASAQLVRAVYRLSVPIDIWSESEIGDELREEDDIPAAVKALMQPMKGTVSSLIIEHGLYEGRFWLPRAQLAEGEVRVGFMRIPIRVEESFEYLSVNGVMDSLPPVPVINRAQEDSVRADSLGLTGDERRQWLSTQRQERREAVTRQCSEGAEERVTTWNRHSGAVPVLVRATCDTLALLTSPDLPPSIFDPGEELFGEQDLSELQSMVGFNAQSGFSPQRPTFVIGPANQLLRYNRVEGLSAGAGLRQELGQGLALEARAQIGVADWQPNGELSVSRTDGSRTVRLGAYRRLAVANDWGTPLGFGSSVNALLFGRDEGFYYRTYGAELVAWAERDVRFEWRLFAERHDDADVETNFSLANALHGLEFQENIEAEEGEVLGVGARLTRTWGLNPEGFRLFSDLRLEGNGGDFGFGRGALDLSLSRPIGSRVAMSLTGSVGGTVGDVPAQRLFYLGGTSSVRGQQPGTMVGDTYWMGRAELGTTRVAARSIVFFDVGWAGDAADWQHPGRLMSGAGVGTSFLDGLIRVDLARGIWPRERWTMNVYLEALF